MASENCEVQVGLSGFGMSPLYQQTSDLRLSMALTSISWKHGSLKAPPFSVWFGTIPAIADLYKHSPSDAPPHCTMTLMYRKHDLGPIYYLDNWPAAPVRQIAINDPVNSLFRFSLPQLLLMNLI